MIQDNTQVMMAAPTQPVSRPEHMLPIMLVLGIMFIGICIAMNLFSRARFKKRANIFTAPALARATASRRRSYRGQSGSLGGLRPESNCPSPMPAHSQEVRGARSNMAATHSLQESQASNQTVVDESGRSSTMTNSLRSCFDHEQNIMITIILLAFSVIGLIGLTIGNRFILIIFSACMILILIASITIYAIENTDGNLASLGESSDHSGHQLKDRGGSSSAQLDDQRDSRLKSLVDKWLSKNQVNEQARNKPARHNALRASVGQNSSSRSRAASRRLGSSSRSSVNIPTTISPTFPLEELSDEPTSMVQETSSSVAAPLGREGVASVRDSGLSTKGNGSGKTSWLQQGASLARKPSNEQTTSSSSGESDEREPKSDELGAEERAQSERWNAYRRYLNSKYLNIVSQSIDLIMHAILAAWMALLLDEDSDQCFGPRNARAGRKGAPGRGSASRPSGAKELPVYNYNGVRYSIRPDVDEPLARVVDH